MRILFITATRVGDAILSTGLLNHLIQENPGARVTVACGPAAADLFEAVPGLENVIVLDKMLMSLHWPRLWAHTIRERWDVLVDLRNSPMYYLLPAKKSYTMGRRRHDVHRLRQLASVLGLEETLPTPCLWTRERHRKRAVELIPDGCPVLAVGPTANWKAKTWRPENFAELIERLTGPHGILPGGRIAILGCDDERPMALHLIKTIPEDRRIDLIGRLDLLEAYACLERCSFYVGNDSGLMHLAAAAGIPTLGLFGPSPAKSYAPWGPLTEVAQTTVPYEKIFPPNFDHKTSDSLMDSLTVDAAETAARKLWARAREAGA